MITTTSSPTRKHLAFLFAVAAVCSSLGATQLSHAQSIDPDEYAYDIDFSTPSSADRPAGAVSCFDYYEFDSVQTDLSTLLESVPSGTDVEFSGVIRNENAYPIVDGALYVKVFRVRGDQNDGNGPDVVDQFLVKGDLSIPARASVPVSFSWRVPAHARSGSYELATFFTTSRKFNLHGLSFTDDIVGETTPFSVVGVREEGVGFDKTSVSVGDEPYLFAAFPPRMPARSPVLVSASVTNDTDEAQRVSVAWTIYQWDAQLRENVVHEERTEVTVPARSAVPVSVTIADARFPVYLAVGELRWLDTRSFIGVRFVREGVDRARINFPGIATFPLVAGAETTLFSCLHNSGETPSIADGRLELTLSDMSGAVIREYVYGGDITADMMGVADTFVPGRSYDRFMLDARLYQGNEFVDEAHLVYDCQAIDPTTCLPASALTSDLDIARLVDPRMIIPVGAGALVLVLVGIAYAMTRSRRAAPPTPTPPMGNY